LSIADRIGSRQRRFATFETARGGEQNDGGPRGSLNPRNKPAATIGAKSLPSNIKYLAEKIQPARAATLQKTYREHRRSLGREAHTPNAGLRLSRQDGEESNMMVGHDAPEPPQKPRCNH
jgi:hypothetical protein